MATVVVTVICIAMIVMGCVILSQGILTSADVTARGVEDISVREGDLLRTSLEAVRAAELSWSDRLRVTVLNTGQTRLTDFAKWDFIVDYVDAGGNRYSRRLSYTTGALAANEWQKARIGLNGPVEYFEPGILDPQEELVILASLDPLPAAATDAEVTVAAANGAGSSIAFNDPGYTLLLPHAENTTIATARYYQLAEAAPADGSGAVMSAVFSENETGRKVLADVNGPGMEAHCVFPLLGIDHIPAASWNITYQCRTTGGGLFPQQDGDVSFDLDILVRQADGGIRQTIATGVAGGSFPAAAAGNWTTINGTFDFPGYDVVEGNDYLEVAFYGNVWGHGPTAGTGYLQLDIDDNNLPLTGQTRIEG